MGSKISPKNGSVKPERDFSKQNNTKNPELHPGLDLAPGYLDSEVYSFTKRNTPPDAEVPIYTPG
jgi:hypothetical protein